jgi:hydroxymethylglutaryl-CoA lyase
MVPRCLRASRAGPAWLRGVDPEPAGYAAARAAGADEVAIFGSASEGFSRANLNTSIAESLDRFRPVAQAALADGVALRGYVSCATDCPFDGPTPPAAVARVAAALRDMGCAEVSVADTLGRAAPEAVDAMLTAVLDEMPRRPTGGAFPRHRGPRAGQCPRGAGARAAGV